MGYFERAVRTFESSRYLMNDRPVRRPDVEWVDLDGEVVVYDGATETLHRLNGSAARVWAACDGSQSVDQLVRFMQAAFADTGDAIEGDVRRLLRQLGRLGLLEVPPDNRSTTCT